MEAALHQSVDRMSGRGGLRSRARAAGSITQRAQQGDVVLFGVSVPDSVPINSTETMKVGFEMPGPAEIIDPDFCIPSDLTAGYRFDAQAESSGNRIASEQFCIPENSRETREMSFTINTPATAGDFDITVQAWGANSGNLLDEQTFTITATEDDGDGGVTPACTVDADCPGDKVCDNGECVDPSNGGGGGTGGPILPCWADPNRRCSGFETAAWAFGGLFVATQFFGN